MAPPAQPSPQPRVPLNRERVLRAALVLADTQGIESLTMRRLGQELGVEAMSLYNHVTDKEDILDGLVDLVFSEIELPPERVGWKTAARQGAISAREALRRHPWATSLMHSRANPGPASLRYQDAVLGSFRRAGFSLVVTAHAVSVIDGYVYGFALQQANMLLHTPQQVAEVGEHLLRQMADEYPHLAEIITDHAMKPGYDYGDEFEFGLDLVLDAVDRLRETGRP